MSQILHFCFDYLINSDLYDFSDQIWSLILWILIAKLNCFPTAPLCRFSFFNLFSGFMIPTVAIGWYWRWFTYVNPVAWSLYGLLASQLGNIQATIIDFTGQEISVADFLTDRFGYHYSMVGPIVAILFAYVLFFRGLSVLFLTRINFQKR